MTRKTPRKKHIGKNGGIYELRRSKYSGRMYKKYLPPRTKTFRSKVPAAKGMVYVPLR